MIGTLALVPQVVDAISSFASTDSSIPVVAAGGVMDGRGLVASVALGAAGVLFRYALHGGPRKWYFSGLS
jgi:nitronate monooxygenase